MRAPDKKLTPFGKLVVKALIDRDMNRAELAAKIGVAPQYLSSILNGTRPVNKYFEAIIVTLSIDRHEAYQTVAA